MDEKPIPGRIADIKSEITALGFGPRLTGITEKSELISLLLEARRSTPAPSSLRKIPVVLLGERHNDSKCAVTNSIKLATVMGLDGKTVLEGKSNRLSRGDFLLISEGRGINVCYETLGLPSDRIIIEHPPGEQSKVEMIDKLILTTELLMAVVEGTIERGRGAEAGTGIPDMVTIGEKFFMDRAKHDGYWPLLQVVPNGTNIYKQMVDAAFARKQEDVYSMYNRILSYLIHSDYLNDVPMSSDIKRMLNSFIQTGNNENITQINELFRLSRDANIIKRVEERARSENSTLKVVVIIFGAIHYDNLRRLISESDVLEFDTRSSNIEYGGRRKTKNTKKRITKKYNSKSKHGKTIRNKRKKMQKNKNNKKIKKIKTIKK